MKKYSIALACAAIIALATTSALAEEKYEHAGKHQPFGYQLTGDIGVFNQYIWRGAPQNVNKAAVQGDMGVGIGDFSASVWFSNTFASPAPQFAGQDAIEFDWTLDYSRSIGDVGFSVGAIYYTYLRDSTANFLEAYGGLSYDTFMSPSVTVYYTVADSSKTANNLNATGDIWIDLGLSTTVMDVDLGATASFAFYDSDPTRVADEAAGQFDDGVSLVTVGISKDFEVSSLTITPSLNLYIPVVSKAPGDDKRYIYNTVSDNNVVFGVNVAF